MGGGGYSFADSVTNSYSAGCYSYSSGTWAAYAFFGTGGTQAEMEEELTGTKYRIKCPTSTHLS